MHPHLNLLLTLLRSIKYSIIKYFFNITTAVLAILLAFTLYKLSEKEFQLQGAVSKYGL